MTYSAFVSYSHLEDDKLAKALQHALHRFAKPWYRMRALRVFRDKTNLSATPALWGTIEQALRDSGFFLLLASPEAARSKWVRKEVEYWKSNKSVRQLLLVLTDGELVWDADAGDFDWTRTTAVPKALSRAFDEEPLWVDFRASKVEGKLSIRSTSFRAGIADLAAPIHGKSKDELDSEDIRQHRKTLRLAWSAVTGLVILLCAAVAAAWIADRQRRLKETQRAIAVARQLAAQSVATRAPEPETLERSALLAIEALRRFDELGMRSLDADQALRGALALFGRRKASFDAGRQTNAVAFSPDGAELVAASVYSGAMRWEVVKGAQLAATRRERRVQHVYLSSNGTHLASADYHPNGLTIWVDPVVDSGPKPAPRFVGERPIALSADGRFLALATTYEREIRVLDVNTRTEVHRIPYASDVAFSRDGRFLAASVIRQSRVWRFVGEGQEAKLERIPLARFPPAHSIAFSPDSRYAVAADRDEDRIVVVELGSGQVVGEIEATSKSDMAIALGPRGRYVAISRLYSVAVHDSWNGAVINLPYGREVKQLAFDPAGRYLAIAGLDDEVAVWEISGLEENSTFVQSGTIEAVHLSVEPPMLTTLTRVPGETGGGKVRTQVWGLGGESASLRADRTYGAGMAALSANGKYVVVRRDMDGLRVWEVSSGREEASLPLEGEVVALAVSDDGRYVAVDEGGRLRVLDSTTGDTTHELEYPGIAGGISLGQHGWYVLSSESVVLQPGARGSRDETAVALWDIRSGRQTEELARGRSVPGVQLGSSGRSLALNPEVTVDQSTDVRETGEGLIRSILPDPTLPDLTYNGGTVTFSPDARHFATMDGGAVRVWNLTVPREIARFDPGPEAEVIAISNDARYVAVLSGDNAVRVWSLSPADLVELSCSMLTHSGLGERTWKLFVDFEPYRESCPN